MNRHSYDNRGYSGHDQNIVTHQMQESAIIPENHRKNHFTIGIVQLVFAILIAVNEIIGYIMRLVVFIAFYWGIGIWVGLVCGATGAFGCIVSAQVRMLSPGRRPDRSLWQILLALCIAGIIVCVVGFIGAAIEIWGVTLLKSKLELNEGHYLHMSSSSWIYGYCKAVFDIFFTCILGVTCIMQLFRSWSSYQRLTAALANHGEIHIQPAPGPPPGTYTGQPYPQQPPPPAVDSQI